MNPLPTPRNQSRHQQQRIEIAAANEIDQQENLIRERVIATIEKERWKLTPQSYDAMETDSEDIVSFIFTFY